jgi:hypothetical protein
MARGRHLLYRGRADDRRGTQVAVRLLGNSHDPPAVDDVVVDRVSNNSV